MEKIPCTVRILSFIDGERSVYESAGEYFLNGEECEIRYRQDSSSVTLNVLSEDHVRMRRTGDCFLDLPFRKNSHTRGTIGLSGGESIENVESGNIPLFTEEIKYAVTADGKSVSLFLKYILRFGRGKQKCAVRVSAAAEGKS